MFIEFLIFLMVVMLFKLFNVEYDYKKIFNVFIVSAIVPYLLILSLIITDNFITLDIQSVINTTDIELYERDGYIGEYSNGIYTIYQENQDLYIPEQQISIMYEESLETSDILFVDLVYEGEYVFTSKYTEFLAKDFFIDHLILKYNYEEELKEENIEIYNIRLNRNNLIKGVD